MNAKRNSKPAARTVSLDNHADLAVFAADVLTVAAGLPGRGHGWGGRKVFMCDVAAALGADLATCKAFMVAAHKAGLLTLARADLVESMDPAKVAASEAWHMPGGEARGTADYHFVRVG